MASALISPSSHRHLPVPLPPARGPITERLLPLLCREPHDLGWVPETDDVDPDDLHLALYCCYELSYLGLPGVSAEWEWEPSLLAVRRQLERWFLADLQTATGPVEADAATVADELWQLARGGGGGPSLSGWVLDHAAVEHLRELAVHRSAYQLKEADPHTWCLPRLGGEAKAVMAAIQAEEYGNGTAASMHSALFVDTMTALGLDAAPNRYLAQIPGVTLATTNLISMLGLHRRWRGALVGHLALFEMTSVGPMGRYASTFRRLGLPAQASRFFDVHVEADRVHQHMAADGMLGGLLAREPELAGDVLFGAMALDVVEARVTSHIIACWEAGRSSLR